MTRPVTTLGRLLSPWLRAGVYGSVRVSDLRLDHRQIEPGALFVALNGSQRHGLHYAQAALQAGAVAVLYDPDGAAGIELPAGAVCLPMAGLRECLGAVAARFFGEPAAALRVIGVTGTNGKTSTVQLLAQALTLLGWRCATLGTLGGGLWPHTEAGRRTTPDAIEIQRFFARMRVQRADVVAMEVSSHALEQGRVQAVPFEIAVFTNLSRDHLDYHGSMDAYLAAKARLFRWSGLDAAVVNIGDPAGVQLLRELDPEVYPISYSTDALPPPEPDQMRYALGARAIRSSVDGLEFELLEAVHEPDADNAEEDTQVSPVRSGLVGRFNVANLLAVIGVLQALEVTTERCIEVVGQLQPVPGRMNKVSADGQPLVVVDYAHTPDALEQALASLRAHTEGELGCVFGCGGERDRGKRPLMGEIAARLADWAVVTDDNPRSEDGDAIVRDILEGIPDGRAQVIRDRRTAIAAALARARAGDAVLIAGKGHEPYQDVAGVLHPFDDALVARDVLLERAA